jgi:hypothetical protein
MALALVGTIIQRHLAPPIWLPFLQQVHVQGFCPLCPICLSNTLQDVFIVISALCTLNSSNPWLFCQPMEAL